ncbi:ATP-binding protein [Nannocystis pusilla]|uniref:ATP-binding protein n=1 Tax=Nannocystis pusilla TaxID=889268 RepID=UPI003B78130A
MTGGGRQPLYGRELELKLLRDNFAEAIRTRVARTVLVVGGPGIGKRALLDRFLAALPRGGCVVLRARGQWRRRNVPLGVFHEMLRQFLDAGPDTSAADIESRLVSERVIGAGELAQALARALGVSPGTGTIAHVRQDSEAASDPQSRRERLWRPIRRLIRALAQRRPVLVVVEDLHHVDAHSAGLLREWLQEPHSLPLMGLATARPGPRADDLRAMPRVHTIELRELDEHARRELVVRRFDDPAEAEELAAAIVARTGGNPLFIEETLADLLRRGVIGPGDDGRLWRVHQRGARIEVPPSVEDALLARLDALDPEARALVDGAAVLGLTFGQASSRPCWSARRPSWSRLSPRWSTPACSSARPSPRAPRRRPGSPPSASTRWLAPTWPRGHVKPCTRARPSSRPRAPITSPAATTARSPITGPRRAGPRRRSSRPCARPGSPATSPATSRPTTTCRWRCARCGPRPIREPGTRCASASRSWPRGAAGGPRAPICGRSCGSRSATTSARCSPSAACSASTSTAGASSEPNNCSRGWRGRPNRCPTPTRTAAWSARSARR